ncbi:MAG: hypothetical protein PF961_17225, partial [Planctomycetota bacterium]|nr:hypothetical protein [Planctomycetota bacterium]
MVSRLERQLRLIESALSTGILRFGHAQRLLAPISSATLTRLLQELVATGMLRKLDAGYAPGPRSSAWGDRQRNAVSATERSAVDDLGQQLACTVTLWAIHGRALRCRYRYHDEHSPALSMVGNLRPLELPVVGGGLAMSADELGDLRLLRQQARSTPLQPGDPVIKRVAAGCLRDGVYDDHAGFYHGSRRLAVRCGRDGIVAIALAASRVRLRA